MGGFVMSRAVFGISRDADGEGRVGEGALMLEGVLLDAAPDLLGDGQRLRFVEAGQDGLGLVAAGGGGRAGKGALVVEGVALVAAPDLLGGGQRLRFVEAGQEGLVLVAAETG